MKTQYRANAKKIIFIAGTGHNGSTLLDLILSSHSHTFGLGEIWDLGHNPRYFKREIPICNINGFNDKFWTESKITKIKYFFSAPNLLERVLSKVFPSINRRRKLYDFLFRVTHKNVLIDNSKNPGWIASSTKSLLYNSTPPELYLIYLTRDGRAVINSYSRKYPKRTLDELISNWIRRVDNLQKLYEAFPGKRLQIRYEDLANTPSKVIKNVCDNVGLDYEESMLEFWKHSHHNIGGNSGTKSFIARFQNKESISNLLLTQQKKEYYDEHNFGIKLDERWKKELSKDQLEIIESRIRHLNKDFS